MIIIASFFFVSALSAQEKIKSKETKEEKAARIESEYQSIAQLIDNKQFILEADYSRDQHGLSIPVTSSLNFIMIDSTSAVIQTGSNYRIGYNGVGGITAEGRIDNWKVVKDNKRKSFYISMNVSTKLGFYDIMIDVTASGNATSTISGTTPGKLIYQGHLVSLPESTTYKGSSI